MTALAPRPLALRIDDAAVPEVSAVAHPAIGEPPPAGPARLAALLVPGAGGSLEIAGLVGLAAVLASLGVETVRANLPHHEAGRRPPRADRSVPALARMLGAARAEVAPDATWLLGGRSYGGRVASLAVADGTVDVAGLVLAGYPLHPPGRAGAPRVEHWDRIDVPTLFLQGTRDTFGGPDELAPHLDLLAAGAQVLAVVGGDHGLDVAGVHAPDGVRRPATEVLARLAAPIGGWLETLVRGPDAE